MFSDKSRIQNYVYIIAYSNLCTGKSLLGLFEQKHVKKQKHKTTEKCKHCSDFCVIVFRVISIFVFNYLLFSKFSTKFVVFLSQEKINFKIYMHTQTYTQIYTHIIKNQIEIVLILLQIISKFTEVHLTY